MEKRHDRQFMDVFDAIRQLMAPPEVKKKRAIGFGRGEEIILFNYNKWGKNIALVSRLHIL